MKITQAIALSVLATSFAGTVSAGPRNWPSAFPSKSIASIKSNETTADRALPGGPSKYNRTKALRHDATLRTNKGSYASKNERKVRLSRHKYAGNS